METTGENLFRVKKERSYISCLLNGCGYGFKNLGMLLRYIWPSLVLTIILPLPFIIFFFAQLDAILRKWTELGYLPNVTLKTMRDDIGKCASRSALALLLDILMIPVLVAGLAGLALPMILGWKYVWSVLIFLLVFVLAFGMIVVLMQIRYSYTPLKECFCSGFRLAYRNFGSLFAFEFLGSLLGGIIIFLGSIPNQVISSAAMQAYKGWQMGDVLDLPALFPLYVILAMIISAAVLWITYMVFSFSNCLMWGNLVNEVPAETETNS